MVIKVLKETKVLMVIKVPMGIKDPTETRVPMVMRDRKVPQVLRAVS
jgi:hypothetical protein